MSCSINEPTSQPTANRIIQSVRQNRGANMKTNMFNGVIGVEVVDLSSDAESLWINFANQATLTIYNQWFVVPPESSIDKVALLGLWGDFCCLNQRWGCRRLSA